MKETEKWQFLHELNQTAEMYNKVLSASLLNKYWEILKDYELEDIKLVLKKWLSDPENRFMATTNQLIDLLKKLKRKSHEEFLEKETHEETEEEKLAKFVQRWGDMPDFFQRYAVVFKNRDIEKVKAFHQKYFREENYATH